MSRCDAPVAFIYLPSNNRLTSKLVPLRLCYHACCAHVGATSSPMVMLRVAGATSRCSARAAGRRDTPFCYAAVRQPGRGVSMTDTALLTGFEAYGGRSLNPSAQLAAALDGAEIGGLRVVGRTSPVSIAGLSERIDAWLDDLRPALVIALGLWPGEPMIRLERYAVNLADFEIADNSGTRLSDASVPAGDATALASTLPLRAIEHALLADGIPARLSNTAGTYLCNATLYGLLRAIRKRGLDVPCGFIHLPYLPAQVAGMLSEARAGHLEINQRADLASMDYKVMERALRLAIGVTAAELQKPSTR